MAGLRSVTVDASHRARRWDAIVLGSGVSALVAAARLGMREQRVLVVEEQAAADLPTCVREPFLLTGASGGGVLEHVLHELKVPLIERRRIVHDPVAYQVIAPNLRLDVGEASLTASELVSWGFLKPEAAEAMAMSLGDAGELERQHMLAAPLIKSGALRSLARSVGSAPAAPQPSRGRRGLPSEVGNAPASLGRLLAAQVRALSNHASGGTSSEACARVLGSAMLGGAAFEPGAPGLLELLRKRVESLYGEFRRLGPGFELIQSGGLAGIVHEKTGEMWLGKAIVIACSPTALSETLNSEAAVQLVRTGASGAVRRLALHFRVPRELLPEGMSRHLILLTTPEAKDPQDGVAAVTLYASEPRAIEVDLVARVVLGPELDAKKAAHDVEVALRALMPFAGNSLVRQSHTSPSWDDDDWLEEAPAGSGWPGEAELRVSSRPPVYRLDRPAVASLGLEGDLLLGWRAGDEIGANLS
ncbi:MAG: hypothetical protein VX246_12840 [Myxococcota bacterium]|nr:hypothetical protein [Myxococcota bacterium]